MLTRETTLRAGLATGALIVAMLAGCSSAAAPPSAAPSASPELSAPATSAPSATPEPAPTGELLYEVMKNEVQAGGHGGAPALAFPSAFIVDYQVDGTCTFTIGFATTSGADGGLPHFSLAVHGSQRSGSWSVSIPAGTYSPLVGPEAGCTFHVLMHTR